MFIQRAKLIVASFLTALIAMGIVALYDRSRLIPQGNAEEFWSQLFEKKGDFGWPVGQYEIGGEYYYTKMYMPGIQVFRVDADALNREFPANAKWLHQYSIEHPDSWQAAGYEDWTHMTEWVTPSTQNAEYDPRDQNDDSPSTRSSTLPSADTKPRNEPLSLPARGFKRIEPPPPPRRDPIPTTRPARPDDLTLDALISKMRDAKDLELGRKGRSVRWFGETDAVVYQRVTDDRFHFGAAVFEMAFLSSLVWFLLWPWPGRQGPLNTALRLALGPTILFLPTYFGYFPRLGFTGNGVIAYPSGGILYPRIILVFYRMILPDIPLFTTCQWEFRVLPYVPQILRPLAGGFPYPMTGHYDVWPGFLCLLVLDFYAFVSVYFVLRTAKWLKSK